MNCIILTINHDITELLELLSTLGYKSIRTFYQHRSFPDNKYFFGKGKLQEVKEYIRENKHVSYAIVNTILKPIQCYNLEQQLGIKVYDRIRLVLEIFQKHSSSKESHLQVESALLQYEIPLIKEYVHRLKSGEHPGFFGGGEYKIEDYYNLVKKRLHKIKTELEEIRKNRKITRKKRQDRGFFHVTITGYANAGKSSLFNILTESNVEVEERLFTTLSPKTKKIANCKESIVITDTIGFIQNLPLYILNSFQSTFEEIYSGDCVLLLLDGMDNINTFMMKYKTGLEYLRGHVQPEQIITVINKIDGLEPANRQLKMEMIDGYQEYKTGSNIYQISCKTREGIENLRDEIIRRYYKNQKFKKQHWK